MPQAQDITVKNGAATPVDKTFTLLTPASGYGSIAEWALKEGTISSVFPTFTAAASKSARSKAEGPANKLRIRFRMPSSFTDSVTGLTNVGSAFEFNGNVTVPDDFPEALKADAAAFVGNLLTNALVKALVKDGLPAT